MRDNLARIVGLEYSTHHNFQCKSLEETCGIEIDNGICINDPLTVKGIGQMC
jgi:hypothetical protein